MSQSSPDPTATDAQPSSGLTSPRALAGLRVGLSGAVPERAFWGEAKDLDRDILRFVAQFTALVARHGGRLVHGSQPTLTPVIARQASNFTRHPTAAGPVLTLVASALWGDPPDVLETFPFAEVIVTPRIGEGDFKDPATRNDSLTALRLTLASQVDAVVAVGGKLHAGTGYNPGVLEELIMARWRGLPCFIVAAFGGLTARLDAEMLRHFTAGNGLDEKENQELAIWDGKKTVDRFVGQLVSHLARTNNDERRPVWPQVRVSGGEGVDSGVATGGSAELRPLRRADIPVALVRTAANAVKLINDAFKGGNAKEVGRLLEPPFINHSNGATYAN